MPPSSPSPQGPLQRSEGFARFTAAEAILKGCLESDCPVDVLLAPPEGWCGVLLRRSELADATAVTHEHELKVRPSVDAGRGVTLGLQAARAGRTAVVCITHDQLHVAAPALNDMARPPFAPGAGLLLLVENDPVRLRWPSPHRLLSSMEVACLEPIDMSELKRAIETGLLLSRADSRPVAALVHETILNSIDTLRCHPNRVTDWADVEAQLQRRRRRRVRISESDTLLRAARRLEVNRLLNLPSPGERSEVGFIVIGPAAAAIRHVLNELQLIGRVPLMELGLVHPLDEPVVSRFLDRCEHVIILEPCMGETEGAILAVAERKRRSGERPAVVWGRTLPASAGEEPTRPLLPDEVVLPSVITRRLLHLFHRVRPARHVAEHLTALPEFAEPAGANEDSPGMPPPLAMARAVLADVGEWLETRAPLAERGLDPSALHVDGVGRAAARVIQSEVWSDQRFFTFGRNAIRQASWDEGNRLFVVCSARRALAPLQRYAEASVSPESAKRVTIETLQRADAVTLRDRLREAVMRNGVTVLMVDLIDPSSEGLDRSLGGIEETAADIDRQGFRRRLHLIQHADALCNLRGAMAHPRPLGRFSAEVLRHSVSYSVDRLSLRVPGSIRLRFRPLLEFVELVRSRPPVPAATEGSARLPTPKIVHGRQPIWRVHFAGTRGDPPGLAARLLMEAGRAQGYHVRCAFDPSRIHAERHAWAQVVFSQIQDDGEPLPITARIPFGNADLLLGLAARETRRALTSLGIAHRDRTACVVHLDREMTRDREDNGSGLREMLERFTHDEQLHLRDFAEASHRLFGTDRPGDLIMLGYAFQRGFLPLSIDAVATAVEAIERSGFARCREAFRAGRVLAVEAMETAGEGAGIEDDLDHIVRRAIRLLRRESRRFRGMAGDVDRLIRSSMAEMPGLGENEHGRQVQREFVRAVERLVRWGDVVAVRRFSELIVALYRVDRGERGRALTRHAVLPLAEVLLIRDATYIARMAVSLPARRHIRRRLDARPGRGDEVIRRFLHRVELIVARYRLRVEFRSSDWLAAVIARLGDLWPNRWRGTAADRKRRCYVIDLIERVLHASDDYASWERRLRTLHALAVDGRIRHLSANAIRFLVEPESKPVLSEEEGVQLEDAPDEGEESGVPIAQG